MSFDFRAPLLALTVGCGARTGLDLPALANADAGAASEGDARAAPCAPRGGGVVTLASATSPGGLAVDATSAYFTQLGLGGTASPTNSVMRVPLCGGTPATLATSVVVAGLALDATSVYWVEEPVTGPGVSWLERVPKAGGPVTTLSSLGAYSWTGPVLDATGAYLAGSMNVTCPTPDGGTCDPGAIVRVPLAGGAPVTLAAQQNEPVGLAVDATYVYWINDGDGSVARTSIAGGPVTTLLTGEGYPESLTLGGSTLYWRNNSGGDIRSISVDGGIARTVLPGQLQLDGLAADATTLYLSSRLGLVESMPLAGGALSTLFAQIDFGLGELVVDATSVYWTDMSSVVRLTPK